MSQLAWFAEITWKATAVMAAAFAANYALRRGPASVSLGREHTEPVAADPRDRVLAADRAHERVGDVAQELVTGRVPKPIVQPREPAEVEHHERE